MYTDSTTAVYNHAHDIIMTCIAKLCVGVVVTQLDASTSVLATVACRPRAVQ